MILFHIPKKNTSLLLRIFLLGGICILAFFSLSLHFINQDISGSTNISINYGSLLRKIEPTSVGMDISGYGYPKVFANDPLEQQKLETLGIKYMRVDLKYSVAGNPKSGIVCAADGCDTRWSGDQWIHAIKAIGAQPVVIVHYDIVDAMNMVKHFNKDTHNYVQFWIVGNEPDLQGIDGATYSNNFNKEYDAMKALDPTIKIGGGATAWYDSDFLQTFLHRSGSRVDFVDFHGYAQKGDVPGNYALLLQDAVGYGDDIDNLRSLIQKIVPARASHIGIEVGEWELDWGGNAQDNTNFHAVWAASVEGHILSSGAGSLFYADKDNALYSSSQTFTDPYNHSVNVKVDDTNPAYHGIGMFTGEGLFQGFGSTLVKVSTTLPNVEVYASDNPKNIVLINKSPSMTQPAIINLSGVSFGKVDIWRKDESVPFSSPPAQLKSMYLHSSIFTYSLPPFSVTTLVVNTSVQVPFISVTVPQPGQQPLALLPFAPITVSSFKKYFASKK